MSWRQKTGLLLGILSTILGVAVVIASAIHGSDTAITLVIGGVIPIMFGILAIYFSLNFKT